MSADTLDSIGQIFRTCAANLDLALLGDEEEEYPPTGLRVAYPGEADVVADWISTSTISYMDNSSVPPLSVTTARKPNRYVTRRMNVAGLGSQDMDCPHRVARRLDDLFPITPFQRYAQVPPARHGEQDEKEVDAESDADFALHFRCQWASYLNLFLHYCPGEIDRAQRMTFDELPAGLPREVWLKQSFHYLGHPPPPPAPAPLHPADGSKLRAVVGSDPRWKLLTSPESTAIAESVARKSATALLVRIVLTDNLKSPLQPKNPWRVTPFDLVASASQLFRDVAQRMADTAKAEGVGRATVDPQVAAFAQNLLFDAALHRNLPAHATRVNQMITASETAVARSIEIASAVVEEACSVVAGGKARRDMQSRLGSLAIEWKGVEQVCLSLYDAVRYNTSEPDALVKPIMRAATLIGDATKQMGWFSDACVSLRRRENEVKEPEREMDAVLLDLSNKLRAIPLAVRARVQWHAIGAAVLLMRDAPGSAKGDLEALSDSASEVPLTVHADYLEAMNDAVAFVKTKIDKADAGNTRGVQLVLEHASEWDKFAVAMYTQVYDALAVQLVGGKAFDMSEKEAEWWKAYDVVNMTTKQVPHLWQLRFHQWLAPRLQDIQKFLQSHPGALDLDPAKIEKKSQLAWAADRPLDWRNLVFKCCCIRAVRLGTL